MGSLELWVNDRLHDVLGLSDRLLSQFMISLAQKSSSEDNLIEKIKDTGTVDINDTVISFARELYNKVRKGLTLTGLYFVDFCVSYLQNCNYVCK